MRQHGQRALDLHISRKETKTQSSKKSARRTSRHLTRAGPLEVSTHGVTADGADSSHGNQPEAADGDADSNPGLHTPTKPSAAGGGSWGEGELGGEGGAGAGAPNPSVRESSADAADPVQSKTVPAQILTERPRLHHVPWYDIVRVNQDGTVREQRMQRRELLRSTGLQPRDLRRIDPHLSLTNSAPIVVVTDDVLLVHVNTLRLAVFATYCVLFRPPPEVSARADQSRQYCARFLEALTARLAACTGARIMHSAQMLLHHSTGMPLHFNDNTFADLPGLPRFNADGSASSSTRGGKAYDDSGMAAEFLFELEVVEAALQDATMELEMKLAKSTKRVEELMRVLPSAMNAKSLEALRLVKQELVEIDARAGALRELLLESLDDEEDVQGLLISRSGKERTQEELYADEEEVEGMLEYHLQRCEAYHSEAERLLENTRDLEESISVSLSARRFEVSKLELWLSVLSFAVANGALVSGIFGMNLLSGLENHPTLFWGTLGGILGGIVLMTCLIFAYISKRISTHASTQPLDLIRKQERAQKRIMARLGRFWKNMFKRGDGVAQGS